MKDVVVVKRESWLLKMSLESAGLSESAHR